MCIRDFAPFQAPCSIDLNLIKNIKVHLLSAVRFRFSKPRGKPVPFVEGDISHDADFPSLRGAT
jgi:hypothetical protein